MFQLSELFIARNTRKGGASSTATSELRFEQLEQRIALAAIPIATEFGAGTNAINNFGLTQIIAEGKNLALVNGFHIIGSATGQDNNDNVNSENPGNSPGVMTSPRGSMPFNLTFTKDTQDKSKIAFAINVGPSKTTFNELNIPLESPSQYFSYYRSSNSLNLRRYDQLPYAYTNENGNYYAGHILGAQWGEMIGAQYTIRVTINSSIKNNRTNSMELQVVNVPGLAGGDRDVEFKFGKLVAGQTASVSGTIQVFKTDQSLLPVSTFQAETSAFHQIGTATGDGRKASSNEVGFLQYGPYLKVDKSGGVQENTTNLSEGSHRVTFRLLIDDNTADNRKVLTLDVVDVSTGFVRKMDITRKMFKKANTYEDFTVDFDARAGQNLEFRVYKFAGSAVKLDYVQVR